MTAEALQPFSPRQPVFARSFTVNAGNFGDVFDRPELHALLLVASQRCTPIGPIGLGGPAENQPAEPGAVPTRDEGLRRGFAMTCGMGAA
jgi:hypothetical protein